MLNLQHLNLKLFVQNPETISLEAFIPVFHQWIQKKLTEEMLLDVADYQHVPSGPGVMLIGHEMNLSVDEGEGRLGLLYNRKTKEEGDNTKKILQVLKSTFRYAQKLEQEPTLKGKLIFKTNEMQWIVNDRLLAPNNEENFQQTSGEIKKVLEKVYGTALTFSNSSDPRKRLILNIQTEGGPSLDQVIQKLEIL